MSSASTRAQHPPPPTFTVCSRHPSFVQGIQALFKASKLCSRHPSFVWIFSHRNVGGCPSFISDEKSGFSILSSLSLSHYTHTSMGTHMRNTFTYSNAHVVVCAFVNRSDALLTTAHGASRQPEAFMHTYTRGCTKDQLVSTHVCIYIYIYIYIYICAWRHEYKILVWTWMTRSFSSDTWHCDLPNKSKSLRRSSSSNLVQRAVENRRSFQFLLQVDVLKHNKLGYIHCFYEITCLQPYVVCLSLVSEELTRTWTCVCARFDITRQHEYMYLR